MSSYILSEKIFVWNRYVFQKGDSIDEVLSYYMGKNTPERQDFIIDNLYIEKDELKVILK